MSDPFTSTLVSLHYELMRELWARGQRPTEISWTAFVRAAATRMRRSQPR